MDEAGATRDREEDVLRFPPGVCFGCSPTHSDGLRLTFRRSHRGVRCDYAVPGKYQGTEGIVHGGIQATLLDETMCAVVYFTRGTYVVTGELALRYRRPCPSDRSIVVEAWIEEEKDRYARVRGEIRDDSGQVLTRAEGKFFYHAGAGPSE